MLISGKQNVLLREVNMRREQIFWKKLISLILCVVMALSQGGLALLAQAELPVGVAGVNDDNPPVTLNVYGEDFRTSQRKPR